MRILLVEDNPDDAQMVEWMLTRSTDSEQQPVLLEIESIAHAGSLSEGRDELEHFDPDIALLDLNLPDSKGIETVERFGRHPHYPPFVVLTGYEERELGVQAIEHGAQDYLYKGTLTRQVLFRTLRYALKRHEIQRDVQEATGRLALTNKLLRQDLQSDLNVIIGESDQLQGNASADEKGLTRIREAGYRMLNKTNAAAQLTETIVSHTTVAPSYELVGLLREAVNELDGDGTIPIELTQDNSEQEQAIVDGTPMLRTALEELLRNTIERAKTSDDASISVSITETTVTVTFVNEGRELSPEHSKLLRDPDVTAAELSTAGVGIQLASIVFDELGCTVSVDHNWPSGSIISVEFERSKP